MTHLTDWQRGYQAGALLAATALLLATGWPWSAAIAGVLTLAYGYLRWAVARRVRSLRAHLKEDR